MCGYHGLLQWLIMCGFMDKFVEFQSSLHGYTGDSSRRLIQAKGLRCVVSLYFKLFLS